MTSRDRITCSDFSFTTQNRLKKSEKYANEVFCLCGAFESVRFKIKNTN